MVSDFFTRLASMAGFSEMPLPAIVTAIDCVLLAKITSISLEIPPVMIVPSPSKSSFL